MTWLPDRLWGRLEARSFDAGLLLEFLTGIRRYPPEVPVYIVMDITLPPRLNISNGMHGQL